MGADFPKRIFIDAVMGVGAILSLPLDTIKLGGGWTTGFEIVSTGTPTGVYAIVGSNQYDQFSNPNAIFVPGSTVISPAFPVPAGAGAQTIHAVDPSAYGGCRYLRLRYTGSGGAGVLNAWAFPRAA